MIKPVTEIPQNMVQKRESYRDRIRADIREALDKGIHKFEFVGDYKYKYLAQYAREEADRIIRNEYIKTVQKHKAELEDIFCDFYGILRDITYIKVTAVRGEKKDEPRVFCEIREENPEEIIMKAILENDKLRKEARKNREEREAKKKLKMEANDETESFDFSEELP